MSGEKSAPDSIRPRGRRRLTADEEHLWSVVARTIKPLRYGKKTAPAMRHKPVNPDAARPMKKRAAADPAVSVPRPRPASVAPPISIARREKQQLARGRAAIAARIDLHGMTQAQAHGALLQFLHRAQASGAKFVLVITGKGAPNAPRGERGVLRRQVPLWLALPEFRACVLGFDVAHVGHGGEGALYVRMSKDSGATDPISTESKA
jgi:DNA-nicking Smr family endonuclease